MAVMHQQPPWLRAVFSQVTCATEIVPLWQLCGETAMAFPDDTFEGFSVAACAALALCQLPLSLGAAALHLTVWPAKTGWRASASHAARQICYTSGQAMAHARRRAKWRASRAGCSRSTTCAARKMDKT
jgi:hypothetical protein